MFAVSMPNFATSVVLVDTATKCLATADSSPPSPARLHSRAQRDVQHRAVLGDVDLLAPEHRVDPVAQPCPLGQLDEESERLRGDALLRVVEEESVELDGEVLATSGVGVEQVAQVDVAHRL